MDAAWRQFIRGFFVFLAVFLLPAVFTGFDSFGAWMIRNSPFLLIWLTASCSAGFFAHRLGKSLAVYRFFSDLFSKFSYDINETNFKKLPFYVRLPLLWASCSRCMSYWTGGILSFIAAALYFQPPFWASGIYFLLMGASLTAAFASFFFLLESISKNGE